MRYPLIALALAGLLLWPNAAVAQPVTLQPRLVAGDSMHYSEGVHTTVSIPSQPAQTLDFTLGVAVSVEDVLDDGSAIVRETIDDVQVDGDLAGMVDLATLIGTQFTLTMHPDGSTSDFRVETGGEDESTSVFGSGFALAPPLPPGGLNVGQSYDVSQPLPMPFAGAQTAQIPVHRTLDAVVTEDDRQAARLIESIHMPEVQVPLGPLGATGTATMSAEGQTFYLIALETGWPVKVDGVTGVHMNLTLEGKQQAVDERLEVHAVMDNEELAED